MIYAHIGTSGPAPAPVMTDLLHAQANAVEHSAAVGGYVDDRSGERIGLTTEQRAHWFAAAAVLREAAHRSEGAA